MSTILCCYLTRCYNYSFCDDNWTRDMTWRAKPGTTDNADIKRGAGFRDTLTGRIYGGIGATAIDGSLLGKQERRKAYNDMEEFTLSSDPKINHKSTWSSPGQTDSKLQPQDYKDDGVESIINAVTRETKCSDANIEGINTAKRKAPDNDIDLSLSLSMNLRQGESKRTRYWDVEEVDSTLSLSLFSASQREKCSIGLNMGSKFSRLNEDDEFKDPILASTLDLTI